MDMAVKSTDQFPPASFGVAQGTKMFLGLDGETGRRVVGIREAIDHAKAAGVPGQEATRLIWVAK